MVVWCQEPEYVAGFETHEVTFVADEPGRATCDPRGYWRDLHLDTLELTQDIQLQSESVEVMEGRMCAFGICLDSVNRVAQVAQEYLAATIVPTGLLEAYNRTRWHVQLGKLLAIELQHVSNQVG